MMFDLSANCRQIKRFSAAAVWDMLMTWNTKSWLSNTLIVQKLG